MEFQHTLFITGNDLCQFIQLLRLILLHTKACYELVAYRGDAGTGNTLEGLGITEGTTAHFSLSSFTEEPLSHNCFFLDDIVPSVQQTKKGISVLLSSLYVIVRHCAFLLIFAVAHQNKAIYWEFMFNSSSFSCRKINSL